MSPQKETSIAQQVIKDWQTLLRNFKEALAKRLWSLPGVSEPEKEMVYKEYLTDLDGLESAVARFHDNVASQAEVLREENDLLRSLLGVPVDEIRTRVVALNQELQGAQAEIADLNRATEDLNRKLLGSEEENENLRKRVREYEDRAERFRAEQLRLREDDVKYFSESQEKLKLNLKDLETRLSNLKSLFTETNSDLVKEKQEEITLLQKQLVGEMEEALKKKQELVWREEEMFAKGVANRVRTALVSLQGQLLLTLERLGLLDPESSDEKFWQARIHLFIKGAGELTENFQSIQSQLQEITMTLDDYLHLTRQGSLANESVSLKELVQKEMAEFYSDRRPTLQFEFVPDSLVPFVKGDRELLQFVVSTLIRNAVEAIPDQKGRVTIILKNRSDVAVVQMTVQDTGPGIPENLRPRLFEPFFSTKAGRKGLNLCRAKKYMELHGGKLELLHTAPEGSTFQIEVPIEGEKK